MQRTKKIPYEMWLIENGEALEELYDSMGRGKMPREQWCKMMYLKHWREFGEVMK